MPSAADAQAGVPGQFGNLSLWGPGNGSASGFVDPPGTSTAFIAADGAFSVGAITQTITGLNIGQTYQVSFLWGAAQQEGYDQATTENWTVGLGNQSFTTATIDNPEHGFTGWLSQTYDFTATDTSEVLSFLANGTPDGVPPFSLLADVQMSAVPEPSTVMLMGLGALGLGAAGLRQRVYSRRKAAVASV